MRIRHVSASRLCKTLFLGSVLSLLAACGGGSGDGSDKAYFNPDLSAPYYTTARSTQDAGAVEASRFLSRATFGSNLYEINWLLDHGNNFDAWIEQQAQLPATHHKDIPHSQYQNGRVEAWWYASTQAPDQLRQRTAWALSQIFVISDASDILRTKPEATFGYYDLLVDHALGNFRDLMDAVTKNLAMGFYLSLKGSSKADPTTGKRPDENYARELMQLFTIGLYELNNDGSLRYANGQPIPTYTQQDVEALARALSGWSSAGQWRHERDFSRPMAAYPEHHDNDEKTFLGHTLPADQSPEQDMQQALDILFNHPNTGPFIAKNLIQQFVTSNPSGAYISRVAAAFDNNGSGVRGDLLAVVRAILLDPEAQREHAPEEGFGKLREPIMRMTHLFRAFDSHPARYEYWNPERDFLQGPLRSPSVFNFYSPDYSPSPELKQRGMVAPEFQITTDSAITTTTNRLFATAMGDYWNSVAELDLSIARQYASNPDNLIDHLDLLLTQGTLSEGMRQLLRAHYEAVADQGSDEQIHDLIYLIVSSAEYAVQQ